LAALKKLENGVRYTAKKKALEQKRVFACQVSRRQWQTVIDVGLYSPVYSSVIEPKSTKSNLICSLQLLYTYRIKVSLAVDILAKLYITIQRRQGIRSIVCSWLGITATL